MSVQPGSPESSSSLAARLAQFFRARPHTWHDGRALGPIAGGYAWRTRVSDLRRPPFGMRIDNRQRRIIGGDGSTVVVSEYRYVPTATGTGADAQLDLLEERW
jgi:hypothetical protein